MNWIIKKLKEQSTIRGIILLAGLAGFRMSPDLQEAILYAVGGGLGLLEVIRNEPTAITKQTATATPAADRSTIDNNP